VYTRVYAARDKQRQCIVSAARKIFPAVAPFSSPTTTLLLQHPGRSAIERRIRQEVKSESYFPGRFFLVSFLLSPPPPGPFSFFFSFLLPAVALISRLTLLPYPRKDGITRQNCKMQTCKPQSRRFPQVASPRALTCLSAQTRPLPIRKHDIFLSLDKIYIKSINEYNKKYTDDKFRAFATN